MSTDVFGDREVPCSLGSVKANIGHLSAAAGVTGLIKAVLALRARQIPPLAGLEQPRKELLDSRSFTVDGVARDWAAAAGRPRRAAVSSFGLGGTNAHVILTEAEQPEAAPPATGPAVVVVSARTEEALRAAADRLAAHLRDRPGLRLPDVALTSQEHRRHFTHRLAVAAEDTAGAADALAVARGRTALRRPAVVFLFPGQGAETPGMAKWPYRRYPSFAADIDRGCEALRDRLGVDLRKLLTGEDPHGLIHRTDLAQPALVLHEYALARLVLSWGVRPAALIGHSVGEFAVAALTEELDVMDMLRLVAERGALMQQAPEGGMVVVLAAESVVRRHLVGLDGLEIATVNAPEVIVVSGPAEAVARLRERLAGTDVQHRVLPARRAFHSWMMADAATRLDAVAAAFERRPASYDVISTLSGRLLPKGGVRPAGYWADQLRGPVRFQDAVESAMSRPRVVFVEVGPGSGLIGSTRQIPRARDAAMVALQRRRGDLLGGVGGLWAAGVDVDWVAVRNGSGGVRVPLPTYPFARTRHWLGDNPEPEPENPVRAPGDQGGVLGQIIDIWRSLLGVAAVEADSDFFVLGGESLLFIRMISQVQRRFGVPVEIAELASAPTPRAIAAQVKRG